MAEGKVPRSRRKKSGQQRRFERLVAEALATLPSPIHSLLDNLAIVAEEEPTSDDLHQAGLGPFDTLFGLYHGVPLTERSGYGLTLPDKVTLFRLPLEAACRTRHELMAEIRRTVVHELAHHLGLSEERLAELDWD